MVLAPGFLTIQSYYKWLAGRVASPCFVVVTANFNSAFDQSFNAALPIAYIELAGANHLYGIQISATKCKTALAKYSIAWLKRFVDGDARYTPFVKARAAEMPVFETRGSY